MTHRFPPLSHWNVANAMTSAGVAAAAVAVVSLSAGRPKLAALTYVVALGMDFADGIVARRLGLQSDFGRELDSLADVVNFCVVPAVAGWAMGLRAPLHLVLLLAYVLAGVWRLAAYNIDGLEQEPEAGQVFIGLPTTYAGAMFLALSCMCALLGAGTEVALSIFFPLAALGMVSGLRVPKRGRVMPTLIGVTLLSVLAYVLGA